MFDVPLHPDGDDIFLVPLEYRVKSINEKGTNVYKVFLANFVNYIRNTCDYADFAENVHSFSGMSQYEIYSMFIKGHLVVSTYDATYQYSPIYDFCSHELSQIEESISNVKIEQYRHFILQNRSFFDNIDWIVTNRFKKFYNIPFADFAKNNINVSFIDLVKLEKDLIFLIADAITLTASRLISDLKFNPNKHLFPVIKFNFEYHLNPLLITDKNELNLHKQTIHAWLKYVFNEIKVNGLKNIEIPKDNLFDEILNHVESYIDKDNSESKEIDYPKHIFANANAFLLFHSMASQYVSHILVSFLFSKMSEKEKPRLVVSNATSFKEWFNQAGYAITLDYALKTYEISKTKEREAIYNIAKSLIFK